MRRSFSLGVSAAAAVAALFLLALPAGAQSGGDPGTGDAVSSPFGLSASVGAQGFVDPASPTTVVVDLSAGQLLVGTVEARMGRASSSTAVEVPAGSAKRYTLALPAPGQLRQVIIKLIPDGGAEQSVTLRMQVPTKTLLVGVLGADDAGAAIRAATTTPLGRTPTVVALGSTDLQAALAVTPDPV